MFGMLKDVSLDFGKSIVGFENLRLFHLEEMETNSPFGMLQSNEDVGIGFVVVSPFTMYPDYEFKLSEEIIEQLKIENPEDVLVFSIVTLQRPFMKSTINLVAPIVINMKSGEARQFILNGTTYSVSAPLFPERNGEN